MNRAWIAIAASIALASAAPPALAQGGGMPTQVGQCVLTTVLAMGDRVDGDAASGASVIYANGAGQVSYEVKPQLADWRQGDPVKMCLRKLPENCPADDTRGSTYIAINLRTGTAWTEADASHSCGGA
ncbi:MAG TPA: hypothetical protein VHW60_22010 [Caulobacteraceae bacterium]|jgi:hypothetical protein|nr:hypothetical protein [Caulobacteraceae bacterium]